MSIDWSRPIQTKDGRKARYLGKVIDVTYPHVIALPSNSGGEYVTQVPDSGGVHGIENVPERFSFERYVNVYKTGCELHKTRSHADGCAGESRIARIRVTIAGNVGQFDE